MSNRAKRVIRMNQTVPQQPEPKERAKASFGIVDEVLKAYNGGETYVKRFLTFVGIGGVITGTALGYRPTMNPQPQVPQTQPIIIHTAPSTSLPTPSPAKPESPPARPVRPSTVQPADESQPDPLPPNAQPKVRPAEPSEPLIATQPVPVQKPHIVISPPALKSPVPSLPFEVEQADQDDRFEMDD